MKDRGFCTALKRVLDVCIGLLLLVILAIPMMLLLLAVSLDVGWPPLFVQARPGLHSQLFQMFKLRTMTNDTDPNGTLLPDERRLTRLGAFLRSTSLDELPELFNVLRGDMSLVGPRPLLPEYLSLYSQRQARRHEVRPGITGLAQVSGRNALTWEQKFELDVYYVDHVSFWLDLKIMALTIWKVIRAEGISASGHATMPPFRGSSSPGLPQ